MKYERIIMNYCAGLGCNYIAVYYRIIVYYCGITTFDWTSFFVTGSASSWNSALWFTASQTSTYSLTSSAWRMASTVTSTEVRRTVASWRSRGWNTCLKASRSSCQQDAGRGGAAAGMVQSLAAVCRSVRPCAVRLWWRLPPGVTTMRRPCVQWSGTWADASQQDSSTLDVRLTRRWNDECLPACRTYAHSVSLRTISSCSQRRRRSLTASWERDSRPSMSCWRGPAPACRPRRSLTLTAHCGRSALIAGWCVVLTATYPSDLRPAPLTRSKYYGIYCAWRAARPRQHDARRQTSASFSL